MGKKEKGRKAPKASLFSKRGNSIFGEEKTFSKLFCVSSSPPPSILPLQKPFSKSFENS
jgi:hypothetical protein